MPAAAAVSGRAVAIIDLVTLLARAKTAAAVRISSGGIRIDCRHVLGGPHATLRHCTPPARASGATGTGGDEARRPTPGLLRHARLRPVAGRSDFGTTVRSARIISIVDIDTQRFRRGTEARPEARMYALITRTHAGNTRVTQRLRLTTTSSVSAPR